MDKTPLIKAVEIVGGQIALAKILGVHQPRIWNWIHRDKAVPGEFVIPIERATGGEITRHQLRPDLYPPNEAEVAKSSHL